MDIILAAVGSQTVHSPGGPALSPYTTPLLPSLPLPTTTPHVADQSLAACTVPTRLPKPHTLAPPPRVRAPAADDRMWQTLAHKLQVVGGALGEEDAGDGEQLYQLPSRVGRLFGGRQAGRRRWPTSCKVTRWDRRHRAGEGGGGG